MQVDVLILSDADMFEKYGHGWARYSRVLKEYRANMRPRRTEMTKAITFYGVTGKGKSERAHDMAYIMDKNYGVFTVTDKGKQCWADGCVDCDVVICDDYEGEFGYRTLLRMVDKHKCNMQTKGSTTAWAPKLIIFTSNIHPKDWYPDTGRTKWEGGPLQRRLTTGGSYIEEVTAWLKEPPKLREIGPPDDAQHGEGIEWYAQSDSEGERMSVASLD